jgi:sugar lactone lactonase YvrE
MATPSDVETSNPRFQAMVLPNPPLELLGDGFQWLEEPVWFADQDCLLFSDLPNDQFMRWTQSGGISLFLQPSSFANGHARDRQGRLIVSSPNGRSFPPDERRLYVCGSGPEFDTNPIQHIAVMSVDANGTPCSRTGLFYKIEPGFADSIRCDEDGNVWSSASDGVHCRAPSGELPGKVLMPFTVSNLTLAGGSRSRLFICASHSLFAIYTTQRGTQRP